MSATAIEYKGLRAWRIEASAGASAIVTEHGAQLVSWRSRDGRERLYLSPRSNFVEGQPIRGGVPVIFPQFGEHGSLRKHGFARTHGWRFAGPGH